MGQLTQCFGNGRRYIQYVCGSNTDELIYVEYIEFKLKKQRV